MRNASSGPSTTSGTRSGNYVGGALVQATIAGITSFIVLTILGVPFAAPLALLVFFFDLHPRSLAPPSRRCWSRS